MNDRAKAELHAWQPLTFGGVASFAEASIGRLLLLELVVASIAAASVMWFCATAWFPAIREAIARLPATGEIRNRQLEWAGPSPVRLVDGTFLSIVVDLEGTGETGQVADLQLEFGKTELKLKSLLGYAAFPYAAGSIMDLNRSDLEPWWGARQPAILAGIGALVVAGLFFSWIILATLYMGPVRLLAFFADRAVSGIGCWRLATAALMPGALFLSGAIFLYSFRRISLVGLMVASGLHLLVAWVYLAFAPRKLPRLDSTGRVAGNPFTAAAEEKKDEE